MFEYCCVVQWLNCVWLHNPMDYSTSGSSVLHHLPVCSNSRPLSRWRSNNLILRSPQSCPASGSFPMSWLFTSGGQMIGASASVLLLNIQGWIPLELTGLISVLFKGLIFSSTIQKHCQHSAFFTAQLSHTWPLEKPQLWLHRPSSVKWCLCFLICCLGLSYLFFQGASALIWLQSPSAVILEPKKINLVTASTLSPSTCHEAIEMDAMLIFLMLSFKPAFSISLFHPHQKAFLLHFTLKTTLCDSFKISLYVYIFACVCMCVYIYKLLGSVYQKASVQ